MTRQKSNLSPSVKTKEERELHFREELRQLLNRHQAELDIGEDDAPYGMYVGTATITMKSIWDDDGYLIAEYCEFEL